MSKHVAPATSISPKVIAPAVFNLALIVVVAAISFITPDLFAGLGVWAPVAYGAIAALGTALAGYIKKDPVRDLGNEVLEPDTSFRHEGQ